MVTEYHGTVTASWTQTTFYNPTLRRALLQPRLSFGTVSYTCTLMYGYSTLSTFTETTTAEKCSFSGLDQNTPYGVRVVASTSWYSSPPVVAFALDFSPTTTTTVHHAKKIIISCVKGHQVRWFAALHPHCPLGFTPRG